MRVVISQNHLALNKTLAHQSNNLARKFNHKRYSRIENIDSILLKRDISIEKKKNILIKKLHGTIVNAFSINKSKFSKKAFDSMKKRIHNIRKIIIKLRSINYYLETTFLEDLSASRIKIKSKNSKLKQQNALAKNELEALEYMAYKLIEKAVMLDKSLLKEYSHKEENMLKKEKIEAKDIDSILRKQSELLEHLEAKLPPPSSASRDLIKEPTFTHWVARVYALLSYFEHIHSKEIIIFSKIKKNKSIRAKITKKIIHLIKEKSKLLKIMEEKAASMKKFTVSNELKKELHNFTTLITI